MDIEIIAHAAFGELSALLSLWAFVEVYRGVDTNELRRLRIISMIALVSLFLAWAVGSHYYLTQYAPVSEVIMAGPEPWAHLVVGGIKKHVFLFLPMLALLQNGIFRSYHRAGVVIDGSARLALLAVTGLLVLLTFSMAGLGYLVTAGFRAATTPLGNIPLEGIIELLFVLL